MPPSRLAGFKTVIIDEGSSLGFYETSHCRALNNESRSIPTRQMSTAMRSTMSHGQTPDVNEITNLDDALDTLNVNAKIKGLGNRTGLSGTLLSPHQSGSSCQNRDLITVLLSLQPQSLASSGRGGTRVKQTTWDKTRQDSSEADNLQVNCARFAF